MTTCRGSGCGAIRILFDKLMGLLQNFILQQAHDFFVDIPKLLCYPNTKETLNKSSAAGQRIFFRIRSVPKPGNISSIPPFLELSAMEKSLAASSCRFLLIESFK